jgi:hypothetical protein
VSLLDNSGPRIAPCDAVASEVAQCRWAAGSARDATPVPPG